MKGYAKLVRQELARHGWAFYRNAAGDHELWAHPDVLHKVTVDNGMKSRHTANAVMKQAGIAKKF